MNLLMYKFYAIVVHDDNKLIESCMSRAGEKHWATSANAGILYTKK